MAKNKSIYPEGFSDGVVVKAAPLVHAASGSVYWVDSNGGGTGVGRGSFKNPFLDIDSAINRCAANKGDVIMVKAGHSETVTSNDEIDLDVAGVTIIGMGSGDLRPTLTFSGTDATACMAIAAADCVVKNLLFEAADAGGDITGMLRIEADDAIVEQCEFRQAQSSGDGYNAGISISEAVDRPAILSCTFKQQAEGEGTNNQGAILVEAEEAGSGAEHLVISNCYFEGDFEVAPILGTDTEVALTDMRVEDNTFHMDTTAIAAIDLEAEATHTGILAGNRINAPSDSGLFTGVSGVAVMDNTYGYQGKEHKLGLTDYGVKKVSVVPKVSIAHDTVGESAEVATVDSGGPIIIHSITGVLTAVGAAAGSGFDNFTTGSSGNLYATSQALETEDEATAVGDILNFAAESASIVEVGGAGVEDSRDLGWFIAASDTIDVAGETEDETGKAHLVISYTSLGGSLEVEGEV